MKRRRWLDLRWGWLVVLVLLAACQCPPCWAAEEGSSKNVEAKIEIGVAAAKAEEAMNARQPVNALKLLFDLVKKHPGNVGALHEYYDFLLKHRIKLSDEERAAAMEYAKTFWPDVETLEDVFLTVSGEQGIKELFARVADDDEAMALAFAELESAFQDNDFKSLAFYAYVATAWADKPIGNHARVAVGETLLRHGDHKAAETEFVWNCLGLHLPQELEQRAAFGRGRCREQLGNVAEAINDYRQAWGWLPGSDVGLSAAERIARIRLDQGNRTDAASWCLQMKSAKPAYAFSEQGLNSLYSEQMASVRKQSARLVSFVEQDIAARPVPAGEQDPRSDLLTHLGNLTRDGAGQRESERLQSLRSRTLLTISAGMLGLFTDPSSLAARAEDLGQAAAALRSGKRAEAASTLDQALLEASDAVIASALREALVKHGVDGMNGARLAAAYLYYGTTRDGGGPTELQQLVSSLSKDVPGLEQLYSSREVTEKIASVAKSARLFEQARSEYRELIEQGIASATDAASLKEVARKAQSVGNRDLGVKALERIRAQFPKEVDAAELTYLLAEAYFQNREWGNAKEAFSAYIKQEKKDEARRMEAEFLSACCDFYPGNYPEAAARFFQFAQKYPESQDVREATHLALVSCSRYAESGAVPLNARQAFLRQVVNDFRGTELAREAHFHLGRLTLETSKGFVEAMEHFEAALHGRRSDQVGFYMGVCHQKLGDLEEAARWYRRAIRESRYDTPRRRAISALRALESSD